MTFQVPFVTNKKLKTIKHVEEDKGYFSLTSSDTSPLPGTCTGEHHVDYGCLEKTSEALSPEQAATHKHLSFLEAVEEVVGPSADTQPSVVEALDSEVEEPWSIGAPLFESSICHNLKVTVHDTPTQQIRHVFDESQESFSSCSSSSFTAFQVKSKVVVPHKPANAQRLICFDEVEWEIKKECYINSVRQHMKENENSAHGAVSELENLMAHVDDQTKRSKGETWQHPSDFTRRNYQKRNTEAKMTLLEWQTKNDKAQKRFSKVPKNRVRF